MTKTPLGYRCTLVNQWLLWAVLNIERGPSSRYQIKFEHFLKTLIYEFRKPKEYRSLSDWEDECARDDAVMYARAKYLGTIDDSARDYFVDVDHLGKFYAMQCRRYHEARKRRNPLGRRGLRLETAFDQEIMNSVPSRDVDRLVQADVHAEQAPRIRRVQELSRLLKMTRQTWILFTLFRVRRGDKKGEFAQLLFENEDTKGSNVSANHKESESLDAVLKSYGRLVMDEGDIYPNGELTSFEQWLRRSDAPSIAPMRWEFLRLQVDCRRKLIDDFDEHSTKVLALIKQPIDEVHRKWRDDPLALLVDGLHRCHSALVKMNDSEGSSYIDAAELFEELLVRDFDSMKHNTRSLERLLESLDTDFPSLAPNPIAALQKILKLAVKPLKTEEEIVRQKVARLGDGYFSIESVRNAINLQLNRHPLSSWLRPLHTALTRTEEGEFNPVRAEVAEKWQNNLSVGIDPQLWSLAQKRLNEWSAFLTDFGPTNMFHDPRSTQMLHPITEHDLPADLHDAPDMLEEVASLEAHAAASISEPKMVVARDAALFRACMDELVELMKENAKRLKNLAKRAKTMKQSR